MRERRSLPFPPPPPHSPLLVRYCAGTNVENATLLRRRRSLVEGA